MKLLSRRRSGRAKPEHTDRGDPAGDHPTETVDQPHPYSTKVEQAAERAADATRTAAATAAAQQAHARPRTSALASLGLVLATAAALTVATGTLARLGIAVGGLAVLVAIAGLAASGRRRSGARAGRAVAAVALLLAVAAIVVGSLAAAGALSWLDTDTDQVARLRDWLPGWLS
ncbi:MAG: hypothetical protein GEV12_06005 [Micromonosporaceae bacterium]|nr:hypothetical protein [Micromonosporaceae bacterium]